MILASVFHLLHGLLNALLLGANTLVTTLLMVPPALLKLAVPSPGIRRRCDQALNALAARWVAVNNAWIGAACRTPWQVDGVDHLNRQGWYLVSSNHQSWVDILVLQRVFHDRIPFLKFFLKRQLFWVPVIGLAWWALDFPFMARGRGRDAHRSDLAGTRIACERFRRVPTAVINFMEGTRYTPAKHARQGSPYQHLLEPKIGGLSVALATMGELFDAMLDVTIVYPDGTPTFWALLSGNLPAVVVEVRTRPIPLDLLGADAAGDRTRRQHIRRWVDSQWAEKDRRIHQLTNSAAHTE